MIPSTYVRAARYIWNTYFNNAFRLMESPAHNTTLVYRMPDRSVNVHTSNIIVRNPEIDNAIKRATLPTKHNKTLMELAEIKEGQARFLEMCDYIRKQIKRRDIFKA